MTLNNAQQQKLVDWLSSKHALSQCPACGSRSGWTPGNIIAAAEMTPGGMRIGDGMMPMVQVVCDNCTHITLFDAVRTGVYTESRECR